MKIITVANRKGGAGKSTCAAHLSLEAVRAGLKTILIDLDPQKTIENWWSKRHEDNPYLIDANADDIHTVIKSLSDKSFDLCIIDTPGDTSIQATLGISIADLIVIPSKPTGPDLNAIGRTISMVKDQKKPYVFILTQAISRTTTALQAAFVLSEFGAVAPTTITNRICYAHAMASGTSASAIDKNAADELAKLWDYIAGKIGFAPVPIFKKKVS